MPIDFARDCWFLTGPTASGKTEVGVALAERLGAEIVGMDSMTVYRRLDIGTAKPDDAQRRRVPHHLFDRIEPHEEYSVAQYVAAAETCAEELLARRRQVLLVGGTPLYLKALLRGIFEGPPADWPLRERLREQAAHEDQGWLHRRLAEVDPQAAGRLHPNDTRRLIRALEVHEKTGRPISDWQEQFDHGRPAEACRVFVLNWPRRDLYARIEQRVERMFAAGLVDEVAWLLARPEPLGRTARKAVGYREVIEHLEGVRDLSETIALIKQHTRNLAKRQMTWFRGLSECRFMPVHGHADAAELAERIVADGQGC